MTLSKFVTCTALAYGVYYIANIIWDVLKSRTANAAKGHQGNTLREIVYDEIIPTERITDNTQHSSGIDDISPVNISGSAPTTGNLQNNKSGLAYDLSLEILHGQGLDVTEANIKKAVGEEQSSLQTMEGEERISAEDFAGQVLSIE